jgi:uncharacterized membrane protein YbhN (UPF0104 family)
MPDEGISVPTHSRGFPVWGYVLSLGAALYLVYRIWAGREQILQQNLGPGLIATVLICAAGYGLILYFLSHTWWRLLLWFGQTRVDPWLCHRIYARTQIAKYLPGNVFHFAGRHVLGRVAGLPHGALLGATVYEALGLVVGGTAVAFCGLAFGDVRAGAFPRTLALAAMVVAIATPVLFDATLKRRFGLGSDREPESGAWRVAVAMAGFYIRYMVFFLVVGAMLYAIAAAAGSGVSLRVAGPVISIFSVAWVAGFLTPGAPAGLGIREAVIVFALTPLMGEGVALLAALLLRLVTGCGDLLYFASSYLLPTGRPE